jgi:hypothetical protein
LVPQSSIKLFFDAIVDSMRPNAGIPSYQNGSAEDKHSLIRKPSVKSVHGSRAQIAPFKFDALELPDDYPTGTRNYKPRLSVVPVLEHIAAMLPYENTELTALGWNEYQEIKLILYSVNFKGKESITFPELKQRRLLSS